MNKLQIIFDQARTNRKTAMSNFLLNKSKENLSLYNEARTNQQTALKNLINQSQF